MTIRRGLRSALPGLLSVALMLGGCGDDDGATAAPTDTRSQTTASDAPAADGPVPTDVDDPNNPWVLGYEVRGPEGSVVDIEVLAVAQGQEQQPFSQRPTLRGEPVSALFTNWVESATLEITVAEGGPVTVEGIRARYLDPDQPFDGIEVSEVHGSVEVAGGATVTLQVP
jgi:hypothetical protein